MKMLIEVQHTDVNALVDSGSGLLRLVPTVGCWNTCLVELLSHLSIDINQTHGPPLITSLQGVCRDTPTLLGGQYPPQYLGRVGRYPSTYY